MKPNFQISRYFLIVIAFSCLFNSSLDAQNWSRFLNGGETDNQEWRLPTSWGTDQGVEWTVDLPGYGQSTPIIFGDSIYVTSVNGPNKEQVQVRAFDKSNGNEKWIFERPNSTPEKNEVMVSRAASSPVADANGVIAFFEGGNMVALDNEGNLRWQRDLKSEFGELKARHGLAASLEQDEQNVYFWAERMQDPFVMAISKQDGATVWKQPGLGSTSWSSPRLMKVHGESQLVLSAMGKIVGLEPTTGNRRWEFTQVAGNSSSTPMPVGDGRFLIGSIGSREGTGYTPSCGLIEIQKVGDGFGVRWVWTSEKATCSFGSPFAFQGRAYFVNRTGIVYCHELETGKQLFVGRLPIGQIWATPMGAGKHVYFFGKDGNTVIVEAADELKIVSENRLWPKEPEPDPNSRDMSERFGGSVLYAASTDQRRLILRRGDRLYSVR
jgi:outer membrane protein assembly factor BamB